MEYIEQQQLSQTCHVKGVPTLEDFNTVWQMFLWTLSPEEFANAFQLLNSGKAPGPDSMPRADTPCWICFEVLIKQVPVFLYAPTQAFKNLEESISGCHPEAE